MVHECILLGQILDVIPGNAYCTPCTPPYKGLGGSVGGNGANGAPVAPQIQCVV